ncbi:MAG: hypothetical protein ACREJ9_13465 [Candidatus Rokuibacteriota bacterium]
MTRCWAAAAAVLSMALAGTAVGHAQPRTPLRNVVADQIVQQIAYCKGEYRLTMATGQERTVREINLRFKTDASAYGPERGRPVLLPAGMQGDRAQLIFSDPEDLKRFLVERCDGGQR